MPFTILTDVRFLKAPLIPLFKSSCIIKADKIDALQLTRNNIAENSRKGLGNNLAAQAGKKELKLL